VAADREAASCADFRAGMSRGAARPDAEGPVMSCRRCRYGLPLLAALALGALTSAGRTSAPPAAGTEMTTTGPVTVRGRVTLEGPAPDVAEMSRAFFTTRSRGRDAAVCLKAPREENEQQVWQLGDGGGVGNVVVWLRPADGSHFVMDKQDLHPKTRTWDKEAVVEMRHLNFSPRILVLFPSYFDPAKKEQVPTGQVFKFVNDAPVACDVKWSGRENPGGHRILPPRGGGAEAEVWPERLPVAMDSSIHPWMRGFAWVFDHPHATVTDRTGRYEIRRLPAGVELRLMAWHEEVGYLYGRDGLAVRLKAGDNRKDMRLRADR
jgi:hypothetical protein